MNKMEFDLLVVYCIFAFLWFLALEIGTYIEVIKKNKSQKIDINKLASYSKQRY